MPKPDETIEVVGYKKPPPHTRFKPKQSGNPNGRPKGSKNRPPSPDQLSVMIKNEGARLIKVTQAGKTEVIPTAHAIVRALNAKAVSGDVKAQKAAMDLQLKTAERQLEIDHDFFEMAFDYKQWFTKEAARRRLAGEPEPKLLFHPDDFELDFENRKVVFTALSLAAKELKAAVLQAKGATETEISSLIADLQDEEQREHRDIIIDQLAHALKMVKLYSKILDAPWAEGVTDCPSVDTLKKLAEKANKSFFK